METEHGLCVSGDNSALSVPEREQTQLCSFRTLGLCSPHLETKAAELIAQQPAARCFVQLPREGLCPTADGNTDAAEASLEFFPMPGPPNSAHLQGFTVLCVEGLLAESFSPPQSPPLLPGLVPSLSMAGALLPARLQAPFPFRANTGLPLLLACLQHISQLIFFFFLILFVSGG